MTLVQVLDKLGRFSADTLGIEPQYSIIFLGLAVALYPAYRRGRLDDRIESLTQNIDYSTGILTVAFLIAYYYQYGFGLGEELIAIAGGFVIGTFVVTTIQKLTGIRG